MIGRFSRILVVESCAETRRATHVAFHALGFHNVDFAPDTRGAIKLLSQHFYRLVLADGAATSLEGLEILKAMRADPRLRPTPLILMIDHLQKKFTEIARDDGLTFYLTKPLRSDLLAERLVQIDGENAIYGGRPGYGGLRGAPLPTNLGNVRPPTLGQSSRRAP